MKTNPPKTFRFLPTTRAEMETRGWDQCDVILVNGDAYIDSPFIGIAAVGRILEREGYRVGIIGQPDVTSDVDIMRLGEPKNILGRERRKCRFDGFQLHSNQKIPKQ